MLTWLAHAYTDGWAGYMLVVFTYWLLIFGGAFLLIKYGDKL
jgi:hypothetical protein